MVKVEEDVVPGIPNHISKCKYFNTSTRQAFRRSGFPESFENKIAPWKIIFYKEILHTFFLGIHFHFLDCQYLIVEKKHLIFLYIPLESEEVGFGHHLILT